MEYMKQGLKETIEIKNNLEQRLHSISLHSHFETEEQYLNESKENLISIIKDYIYKINPVRGSDLNREIEKIELKISLPDEIWGPHDSNTNLILDNTANELKALKSMGQALIFKINTIEKFFNRSINEKKEHNKRFNIMNIPSGIPTSNVLSGSNNNGAIMGNNNTGNTIITNNYYGNINH